MERTLFWFLGIMVVSVACIHAYLYGAFHYIYGSDMTKISVLITFILLFKTLKAGSATFRFEKIIQKEIPSSPVLFVDRKIDEEIISLSFWEDWCVRLGLAGTLIGFIFIGIKLLEVLNSPSYSSLDASKILAPGNGIALMTSFMGMIAGLLLDAQRRNLELLKSTHAK